jgi:hypothetical protein
LGCRRGRTHAIDEFLDGFDGPGAHPAGPRPEGCQFRTDIDLSVLVDRVGDQARGVLSIAVDALKGHLNHLVESGTEIDLI